MNPLRNAVQINAAPLANSQVATKGLTIVNDGFIPRETVTLADVIHGGGRSSEGLDSNVVMAPVMWIMRTFPDAVARVERRDEGNTWDWVDDHDVEALIAQPNDWYGGDTLWQATCLSYVTNGNGYWEKVRNRYGRVIQLWYRPHWLMRPHTPPDGSALIDYYEFDTGREGSPKRLLPRDVVHFRLGLDPRDTRLGFSPLRPVLREMFTDIEAAKFSIKILENMGIPGVTVSPKDNSFRPTPDDVEKLKDYLGTAFTGEGRGSALVFGTPTDVAQFGFDPSKLTLSDLRNTAEERICAILGIPTAVVGFRSGLEQTKVGATMRELRRLAWTQCLLPMQRALARQLTVQLLSDFTTKRNRERIRFDVSEVERQQAPPDPEDKKFEAERVALLVEKGVLRVDRAQGMLGLEVDDTQEVYLRPTSAMPWPPEAIAEPLALPAEDPGADTNSQQEE